MRSKTWCLHLACLALVLLVTACEDPSNIGIGLIGEQGGTPMNVTLKPSVLEPAPVDDVTGGAPRVLAGSVQDPALGLISATGYVDFVSPSSVPSNFRNGRVASAELRLTRNYLYGDTTATVRLRLRAMPSAWTAIGGTTDTTLAAGAVITEFSFPATDTLVVVPLPESWVAANDTTLRSTRFGTSFHGFAIEGAGPSTVAGFNADRSVLRAVAGTDTVNYGIVTGNISQAGTLTTVERAGTPTLPGADRLLLQDGVGPGILFGFDFAGADLTNNAVNRVAFRFHADSLAFAAQTPTHFYRPPLPAVKLLGVASDGRTFDLGDYPIDARGRFTLLRTELTGVVQRILLGGGTIEQFKLVPPGGTASPNTINALVLYGSGTADLAPEAVLTVVPPAE